jgi:hypothetical protein
MSDDAKSAKDIRNTGNRVAEHLMNCEYKSCHFKSDQKEEEEEEEVYDEIIFEENEDELNPDVVHNQDVLEAKDLTIEQGKKSKFMFESRNLKC